MCDLFDFFLHSLTAPRFNSVPVCRTTPFTDLRNLTHVESSQSPFLFSLTLYCSLVTELVPHSQDRCPILFLSFRVWNSVTSLPGNTVLIYPAIRLFLLEPDARISDPKFFLKAGPIQSFHSSPRFCLH